MWDGVPLKLKPEAARLNFHRTSIQYPATSQAFKGGESDMG
jgi:hypothetical protein